MGALGKVVPNAQYIVLFDGVCNLCSGSVQFIIPRDKRKVFQFASLQSAYGQQQLANFNLDKNDFHSFILIKDKIVFQRSDAALEIAKKLSGLWPAFYIFKILPRFIRNGIYNWIARNRYRFFGKKDACWIPTPELRSRFID